MLRLTLTVLMTLAVSEGKPFGQEVKDKYLSLRSKVINDERSQRVGGAMVLTPNEMVVNDLLMKEKQREMDQSRLNQTRYINSASFYLSKDHIDKSVVYSVIKRMPKGAALHVHDLAVGQVEWLVRNATYRTNASMCVGAGGYILLSMIPSPACSKWTLVADERAKSGDANAFDNMLIQNISMLSSDPLTTFSYVDEVWARFNAYFAQVSGMLSYEPVMRDYFRQALEDFYNDNVQYIEMRALLSALRQADGSPLSPENALRMYKAVADDFAKQHPDFDGIKFISTAIRNVPVADMLEKVKEAIDLRAKFPDFMLGFDLVGQEDPNYSLEHYLDALLYPAQQDPPIDLPYFFHAGESNWQGTAVDYNLADAILLNASRIGHGYALIKHPKLAQMVQERDIAVEINPISNQLLGLVKDLRNHALIPLLADNFPVVVSSDDPGVWAASPLSHDFYVAFMDMSGRDADLTLLKQLAINSIKYSKMSDAEKAAATRIWTIKWTAFINEIAETVRLQQSRRGDNCATIC